ncbi:MAG: hypothetical protein IPJ86_06065 [Bacteroidetes bacterium]|nr:hypothetical protein [Bacteroidota bacterium]
MTTTLKIRTILCLSVLLAFQCLLAVENRRPQNTIILLDLSDRLLVPGQISKDTSIIIQIFIVVLRRNAMQQLIMTCRNRFSIVIAPQKSNCILANQMEEALTLDLSKQTTAARLNALKSFSKSFEQRLKELYVISGKSKASTDYSGSDLWRYFNEQLVNDVRNGYDNTLIVLTDGYFDFEDMNSKKQINNRHTTTLFLKQLHGVDWREKATREDYGLLKVRYSFPGLQAYIVGIRAKCEDQTEVEKLEYFWKDWLFGMKVINVKTIPATTTEKIMNAIAVK